MVKAECLPSMSQINNLSSFLTCPGPGTVRYEYNKKYIWMMMYFMIDGTQVLYWVRLEQLPGLSHTVPDT